MFPEILLRIDYDSITMTLYTYDSLDTINYSGAIINVSIYYLLAHIIC